MAIADVAEYAHLSEADIEALAAELEAIRRDIEDARGQMRQRIYPARHRVSAMPRGCRTTGYRCQQQQGRMGRRHRRPGVAKSIENIPQVTDP